MAIYVASLGGSVPGNQRGVLDEREPPVSIGHISDDIEVGKLKEPTR